jgi:cell wall-associated NlpC family hydrolase
MMSETEVLSTARARELYPLNPRIRPTLMTCLALTIALTAVSPAMGATIAQKQAEADRIEAQVETLNSKAEIATEKYNTARYRYESLSDQVRTSNAKIKKLRARTKVLQTHLDTRANEMYRSGPLGFVPVLLNVNDFEELDYTIRVLTSMNQSDAQTVAELKQNKAEEAATNAKLVAAKANAAKQKKSMSDNEDAVKGQLADRQRVLDGLNGEVRNLLAQKKAADEAAARARYAALVQRQSSSGTKSASSDSGGDAPTSSKGAAAVYWAMKAIGKPYRYGAGGPNAFDCSGLTSWAYGKAGISLPHSSGAQISQGPRISKSNLEPGDLVFFGSPIHHVGMYVGGGDFIEAPYTGMSVRVVSLGRRSDYVGACRPQ